MFRDLLKDLEKRPPFANLEMRFQNLFRTDPSGHRIFSDQTFSALADFIEKGEDSFQGVAVQAGVRWASASQRVQLRNALVKRGFLTPSCLWAYRELRGHTDELFREFASSEVAFMQIVLLKEAEPERAVPFLIERCLTRRGVGEELRSASRLCILRLLDACGSPDAVRSLQARYPKVEVLFQWRPAIPGRYTGLNSRPLEVPIDFHQLVRSVHDLKEFSSLSRVLYLLSQFYIPLSEREWRSLWLSSADQLFFHRLRSAGMVESCGTELILTPDANKLKLVRKFLYDSYSLAKETVARNRAVRLKEERERRVRDSELDRQALEVVPDGIICVNGKGRLYYMNPAAERMLGTNNGLRERLFGNGSLEEALSNYSRQGVLSRIAASGRDDASRAEIFGDRVVISTGTRCFELHLGPQVVLMRDTTDQHLIDEEVGKLYRHELKAALDVLGAGLAGAKDLAASGKTEEAVRLLEQAEDKRSELVRMLEERIDFIRIHSDSFQIRPSTVNLNLIADRVVVGYREAAAAKGVRIESNHLDVDAVFVRGEDRFLHRAVDNIVRNAVKFTGKGTKITVTVGEDYGHGFISVKDKGPGIPPQNLGKVFQLGFTTGGTGRGLYLARKIAVAHGGAIELKTTEGEGSCFTLRLPAGKES